MKEDYLRLTNLVKIFGEGEGEVRAVDNVELEVREGELVTLLGPSGCGKTTTLRMIAGFEFPSSGEILIDDEKINEVPPNRRPTTMVFQNYALFPHMTVGQNISYGLRIKGGNAASIKSRTEEIMRLVGLQKMGDRSPAQLSGGQQQRVSLARSLVMEPKVLLLDEPLSNLDAKLRVATRLEIRRLQQRVGITSVYVTHDQEEAMVLSDRIVIMRGGKIQQVGTPHEIYAHPANRFVADFIGRVNFVESRIAKHSGSEVEVELFGQGYRVSSIHGDLKEGDRTLVVVRPETVELTAKQAGRPTGTVTEVVYLGNEMTYRVRVGEDTLTIRIADPLLNPWFAEGDEVSLIFKEKSLHVLPYEPPEAD